MHSASYTTEQMGKAIIQDLKTYEVLLAQPAEFVEWCKERGEQTSGEPMSWYGVEYTDSYGDEHMIFLDPAQAAYVMIGIHTWLSEMFGEDVLL